MSSLIAFLVVLVGWLYLRSRICRQTTDKVKSMVVLGSGGHTAEMFRIVDGLDKDKYTPRVYVAAATDTLAATKVQQHESRWLQHDRQPPQPVQASIRVIPRSREVGQSWVTSALSTAWATAWALVIVWQDWPRLVLANGPGTCLPICLAAHFYRLFAGLSVRVVFVESIARTERLSLTGAILYRARIADAVLVQWDALQQRYPGTQCAGRVY